MLLRVGMCVHMRLHVAVADQDDLGDRILSLESRVLSQQARLAGFEQQHTFYAQQLDRLAIPSPPPPPPLPPTTSTSTSKSTSASASASGDASASSLPHSGSTTSVATPPARSASTASSSPAALAAAAAAAAAATTVTSESTAVHDVAVAGPEQDVAALRDLAQASHPHNPGTMQLRVPPSCAWRVDRHGSSRPLSLSLSFCVCELVYATGALGLFDLPAAKGDGNVADVMDQFLAEFETLAIDPHVAHTAASASVPLTCAVTSGHDAIWSTVARRFHHLTPDERGRLGVAERVLRLFALPLPLQSVRGFLSFFLSLSQLSLLFDAFGQSRAY
jgi:hypothetical protein